MTRHRLSFLVAIAVGLAVILVVAWLANPQPMVRGQVVAIVDARVAAQTMLPGYRCSGVALSQREVMTAAHCLESIPGGTGQREREAA
jgi:hypothetical protein